MMSIPILSTKFFIPTNRSTTVSRMHLIERVEQGLNRKLTLISAPAGFGKTSLLADSVGNFNIPIGWLSLDEQDNDKTRFLKYFINALQQIEKGVGENILLALRSQQPLETEILVAGLINEIADIDHPFVVVLDDYHVITDSEIQQILLFLLDNQPPQMHIIISSRADPPWPLARFRARGEIVEIRIQDLRFTSKEITIFLNEIMEYPLSSKDLIALEKRTEGWIAGLQMVALALQNQKDKASYIQSFTGSHRYILDYLMEEVINSLPDNVREFLLRTSILDRFNGSLCDFVLERENSRSMLMDLELKNIFLISLDDQRNWFRYHHLFADLLRNQLNQEQNGLAAQLHIRASTWFEQQGMFENAVTHSVSAEDFATAADILERNVIAVKDIGELPLITKWLRTFPDEIVFNRPWLCVANAWVHAQLGNLAETNKNLSHANASLAKPSSLSKNQIRHITGHILAIEAYTNVLYYKYEDLDQALELANKALDSLPETDLSTRGFITVLLGKIQRLQLELAPALQSLNTALEIYRGDQHTHETIYTLGELARVYRARGELNAASSVCEEAIKLARDEKNQILAEAYMLGTLGRIYYEWNRLDDAKKVGEKAVELSLRLGQFNTLYGNYFLLAKIYTRNKQFSEAIDAINKARDLVGKLSDVHAFYVRAHEASIQMEMGKFKMVKEWIDQLSFQKLGDGGRQELAPIIISLYRADYIENLDEWLMFLAKIQSYYLDRQMKDDWLKTTVQYAMALQATGDINRSITTLDQVIVHGKMEGYMRSFLDQGKPMYKLLREGLSKGMESDYTIKLIHGIEDESGIYKMKKSAPEGDLIDPLSKREIEVLRLLNSDLSVPEISSHLHISVSTLRTHVRNIYEKLGVHSRFEATTKGKTLGLI